MKSSPRAIGLAVLAAMLLSGAPPLQAYKGILGHFDAAGGVQSTGSGQGIISLGAMTIGTSVSADYETREGMLAVFGRPVFLADRTAIDFGVAPAGGSRDETVTARNYGGVALLLASPSLASSSGTGPFAIVAPSGTESVRPGGALEVILRFEPDGAATARDTLLVATNDPAVPIWRVPLSGRGEGNLSPEIALSSGALDFGRSPVDSVATRTLEVENVGGADLHVGPIGTSDPAFDTDADTFTLGPGESREVLVSFRPAAARVYADTLFVPCDDPVHPEPLLVLLSGRVPSVLAIAEPEDRGLRFEAVLDGVAPGQQEVRIRNDGAEVLRWKAEPPGAAWLEAAPDSGSVLPGNTTNLDVAVAPAGLSIGDHEADLVLRNGDRPTADADTIRVTLRVLAFSLHVSTEKDTLWEGTGATVDASAGTPLDSGRVFYRMGGERTYESLRMESHAAGSLSALLPGASSTIRGVEWFVRAYAGGEEVVEPDPIAPARVFVEVKDALSPALPANEHRMIAVPLATGGSGVEALLADDLGAHDPKVWRLGRWSPEESRYREHPADLGAPLDAGSGFWLIANRAAFFDASGVSVFPAEGETLFSIPLAGGAGSVWWTQIGHPFAFPVVWSSCLVREDAEHTYTMADAASAGLIENAAYAYAVESGVGRYDDSPVLEPWQGYFVNNVSGGPLELLVPLREESLLKTAGAEWPARPEAGWEIRIQALAARGSCAIVIGEREGARSGWDGFDHYAPPSPDGSVRALAIRGPGGMPAPDDLRADIRAPSSSVVTWDLVVRFERPGEVLIFTEGKEAPPAGIEALLVDDVAGTAVVLPGSAGHRIVPRPGEEARMIRIAAGPAASLRANGYEPESPAPRFAMERPYPNPATRGTTVRYSVPEDGPVRLRLFSIEGRFVRELETGSARAGEHIAVWDGKDGSGRDVPPGLYFFRLDRGRDARTTRVVVFH